ncbi:putative ABC transport system permease protein [Caloranaerobacter azorensis DSM 13643]|uniref:Putative ABC transport system permease protein n=1 Tax=Caloranaerobacter azorensis DSM 13643 TaxID=1121264 RepID=A0A1M5U769_9FIRM|nr:ABC transporter permease [Caloranaerobacter azorensis]SHH58837.1 putative ABC transport system permease protein [Caloranaerobacter azorensis DSM 13643]
MNFLESIKVALSSLWANRMRSFLTMLGIIIGIASVITIVSLGQGSKAKIGSEFERFGTNRVVFWMNWNKNPKYRDQFDDDDIENIKRVFKNDIKAISPNFNIAGKANKGRETASVTLYGVNEDYNKIENIDIVNGRFLLESDVKGKRSVGVIDKELAMKIFKRTNVIGEKILVDTGYSNISFTIVGVYETKASSFEKLAEKFAQEIPTNIYLPVTYIKKLGYGDRYWAIEVNMADSSRIEEVSKDIIKLIERRHRNSGNNYYMSQSAKKQMQIMDNILGILSKVVGAIAAISLLVGGIGVMNIMLVSVTERTREIGIRKAIGARRKDILMQFLVEAMIISGIGGLIGTILGLAIANIIAVSMGLPPTVSIATILIAVLFSAGVGIFFGIYPANKAAKLDPIEALRYE